MVRRELLVLSLYSLLANNRGSLFLVYFPIYLVEVKGASAPYALALVSLGYVAASLIGPVVGRWSDRIGRRKPFLLAAEVGTLPLITVIPFLPSATEAGIAFIAAQIVLAVGSPALNAFVSDLTKDAARAEGYSWLNATANLGAVPGFLIVGALVSGVGLVAFIPFVLAVMVGTITIVVFAVPDLRSPPAPERRPLREMKEVATFSFTVSIRALGAGAVGSFYGVFASSLGASGLDVALVAVAGLIAGALLSIPAGRQIDSRGEIWGIFWGTMIGVGGIAVFLYASEVSSAWTTLVPAQVLRVVGITFLSPAMLAWVSRRAPPGRRAEYLGFFSLINSTMWSLGPLAGGAALALGGTTGLFVFALVATLISIAAIEGIYVRGRRGRPSRPAMEPPVSAASPEPSPAGVGTG